MELWMEVCIEKIGQGQGPESGIEIHAHDVLVGQAKVHGIHNRNAEEGQGKVVLGRYSHGEEELVSAHFAGNFRLSGEQELEKVLNVSSYCF